MNFCPDCGADLRNNQTAKFCYGCGNHLKDSDGLNTNHIENVDLVKTDINPDDDFNYFDFPEEKYFREFMLEVMEYVELNPNLSNEDIAEKYFKKGEELLNFIPQNNYSQGIASVWNDDYSDDFGDNFSFDPNILQEIYSKVEDFYLNKFNFTSSCFKASLFFNPNMLEAHRRLFVCYHLCKDFDEAQNCLIKYAETARDLFGSDSSYLKEAGFICNQYSIINQDKHNLNQLPSWILKYDSLT